MKCYIQLVLCLIISFLCYGNTPEITQKTDESINRSILEAMTFMSKEQKPRIKAIKLSADEIKQIFKTDKDLGLSFYLIETEAFEPGTQYTVYNVNMCLGKKFYTKVIANKKGQLCSEISDAKGKKLFNDGKSLQISGNFMNGESTSYAFVQEGDKSIHTVTYTPNPIEHTWSDGSYACIWMVDINASSFMLTGKGFKANESLSLISQSGDEKIEFPLKATQDGLIVMTLAPAVVNKNGGRATLTINREKSDQPGTLSYFWGSEAKDNIPKLKM